MTVQYLSEAKREAEHMAKEEVVEGTKVETMGVEMEVEMEVEIEGAGEVEVEMEKAEMVVAKVVGKHINYLAQ